MKSDGPDPRAFALFQALARQKSLPAAAASLGLSTFAFARSLNSLRKQLADPMFVRSLERIVPATRAAQRGAAAVGASVGASWREMFDVVRDRLDPAPRFDARVTERTFNVALDDAAIVALLPALQTALRKHAPRAGLVVSALESLRVAQALAAGHVDLAIGMTARRATGVRDSYLYADPIVALRGGGANRRGKSRSASRSASLSLAQLRAARHLVVGAALDAPQIAVIGALMKQKIPPSRVALAVPSHATAGLALTRGDYLLLAPERVAEQLAAQTGARIARLPFEIAPVEVRMAWHEKFHRDAGGHWLRRLMLDEFGHI